MARAPAFPLWARLPWTLLVLVVVPVYWVEYGPGNFLWFSDIAVFAVLLSLWTGWRLPYSMMAVGVLPLELVWTIDILTMGELAGLAEYMFDPQYPLWLRALSLFHVPLLGLLVWMLFRRGYDPRALGYQTLLAWVVLPASFLLTGPEANVNWVHGFGPGRAEILPPLAWLAACMALLPLLVYLPMHLLLRRLFGAGPGPLHRSAAALRRGPRASPNERPDRSKPE